MIEAAIGLLCFAAGLAAIFGITGGVLQLGGLEFLVGMVAVGFGLVLMVHGLYREVRNRRDREPHGLRTRALMLVTVASALVIVVAGIGVFGQMTFSGIPVGYHAVAEGVPVALFLLFKAFKGKQGELDREGLLALTLNPELPDGLGG